MSRHIVICEHTLQCVKYLQQIILTGLSHRQMNALLNMFKLLAVQVSSVLLIRKYNQFNHAFLQIKSVHLPHPPESSKERKHCTTEVFFLKPFYKFIQYFGFQSKINWYSGCREGRVTPSSVVHVDVRKDHDGREKAHG